MWCGSISLVPRPPRLAGCESYHMKAQPSSARVIVDLQGGQADDAGAGASHR